MTDRRAGIAIGLVLGIAAVALFVFVFSDDAVDAPAVDETTTATKAEPEAEKTTTTAKEPKPDRPLTIEVEGGQPVDGVAKIEVDKGEQVVFQVRSDIPEHVHVHGYDLFQDVAPGAPARFGFDAEIDGIFEIELEDSAVLIAELRVNP